MGTSAPKANAVVSVTELSKIDGPIFDSVRATRSSGERCIGTVTASLDSGLEEKVSRRRCNGEGSL